MGRRITYLALAVSLGLNAGLLAVTLYHSRPPSPPPGAPGPPPAGPPAPGRLIEDHVRGITQHLGLSVEQQQEIRIVLEKHVPHSIGAQRRIADLTEQLSEAFAAPAFDAAAFQQLARKASAARATVDSAAAVMLVAEAAVLTPEQRVKFAEVAPTIHLHPPQRPRGSQPPPR